MVTEDKSIGLVCTIRLLKWVKVTQLITNGDD